LFENPYVSNKDIEELKKINHKPLAEKAAAESFVLLQNNHQTLPISEKYKKILVVGTDAVDARLGGYSGPGNKKSVFWMELKISLKIKISKSLIQRESTGM
jgi:beta-glucosidase